MIWPRLQGEATCTCTPRPNACSITREYRQRNRAWSLTTQAFANFASDSESIMPVVLPSVSTKLASQLARSTGVVGTTIFASISSIKSAEADA